MSGIGKAIKKVWRPIEKLASKVTNITSFGLHDKWKKVRHKIIKSKIFKVVVAAVAIYFGGAALLSMMGGGTASAGIGSAWAGAQGAGSALAAGNVAGAGSALSAGFTGGAAAGASAGFAAGQAATAGTIASNAAATTAAAAGTAAVTPAVAAPSAGGMGAGALAPGGGTVVGGSGTAATTAGQAASGGLLGEAGKAALITGGINMAGSMISGKAQADAAEEEQKRRTYWGVDGEGNQTAGGGLLNPASFSAYKPIVQPPPTQSWQTSLDGLIERQKQLLGQG